MPVVEIELPSPENIEDVIFPGGIDFEIPAEKAAILDKNPCAIIASKNAHGYIYFLPWRNDQWYRVMYDESTYGAVTSNIQILEKHEKNIRMSILLKAMEVVEFVSNEEPSFPLTGFLVPTIKAVYDEINKTK